MRNSANSKTGGKKSQSEMLEFASLIAHQLQSPIGTVSTILNTLVSEAAGPLTSKQKDLLARANARCEEGVATVRRTLAIVSAMTSRDKAGVSHADIAAIVRKVKTRYEEKALQLNIIFTVETNIDSVYVRGAEPALTEVLDALVDNALKYTPGHGRIRVTVFGSPCEQIVHLSVADSGVGIPEGLREKVFEPFYRTPAARDSTRTGIGLGLSFVKAVIEELGGTVQAGKADLGGAEIALKLPMFERTGEEPAEKPAAFKVIIVGGVAAGPKVASKVIRLVPEANVTVIEKGEFLSYAGCGLPYYISGVVKNHVDLMSTPMGALRDLVLCQV